MPVDGRGTGCPLNGTAILPVAALPPWRRSLAVAAWAFVLSRLIVFAAVLLPTLVAPDAMVWSAEDRVLLAWSNERVHATLERAIGNNDAGWYRDIAINGYATEQAPGVQSNHAFFPLQPMLWRGGIALFGDGVLAPLLLAQMALFMALLLLHRVALASGRSAGTADRAVWVLALFPVAYFLSFPWTEALFLALTLGAVHAAQCSRWVGAGALGALASSTRLAGVFLAPLLLVDAWRRGRIGPGAWLATAAVPIGLLVFMAWLWMHVGDPLAFSAVQSAWGREFGLPLRSIGIVLLRPWEIAVDWNLRWLNLGALLLGAAATWHLLRRREWGFAAFLALGLLAPLLTDNLTSLARYLLGLFPVMLAIADACDTRAWLDRAWFALSTAVLVAMSVAFGLGLTFAVT